MPPKKYTAIKESCMKKGMDEKACKTKAAKIFNATRPKGAKPVTRKSK